MKHSALLEAYRQWCSCIPSYFVQSLPTPRHRPRFRFELAVMFCGVPPVIPPFDPVKANQEHWRKHGTSHVRLGAETCIVCGKVHVTSETCGREPIERKEQNERELGGQPHYGHKLAVARDMGFFSDGVLL